tara:strand:- start:306 stop:653 length:348 start_codon:yes stop_codon:yes gene_type:complete
MEEYVKMLQKAWCQYIVCVLSRDAGSRFPNMNKMSRAMGNGLEQLHAFNGGMQIQAPNFAQFLPPTAVQPTPEVAVQKPKDDARLTRVETKIHEQGETILALNKGITTLLQRIPE